MAALQAADRQALAAQLNSDLSSLREPIAINKTQLSAALAAADDFMDANAAAYNSALPAAARSGLTAAQKARLLSYVIKKRFEKGA